MRQGSALDLLTQRRAKGTFVDKRTLNLEQVIMNWRVIAALAAGLAVASCGGNPFDNAPDGGGGGGGGGGVVPTPDSEVNGDMRAFRFNGSVLEIDMTGVSSSGQFGRFNARPSMNIIGTGTAENPQYLAYEFQETGLTRSYLAYVAGNTRRNLQVAASADGGQFNERNGGGRWLRVDTYTRPTITAETTGSPGPERGTFSYVGTYAGVFVPGQGTINSLPPSLRPGEPFAVDGVIQINAQFERAGSGSAETVEGGIANRRLLDREGRVITTISINDTVLGDNEPILDNIVLRETTINANGEFLGSVEFAGSPNSSIGDFGGAFGGTNASDVAGVILINPIRGQNAIWEFGAFNLPRCDLAGSSPLCLPR
jgi:hypothetical protein